VRIREKPQRSDQHRLPPAESPRELPLPGATREVLPARLKDCRNVGLLFDRYVRFQPGWQLGTYKKGNRDHSAKMFNIEEIAVAQIQCRQDRNWQEVHSQFVVRWKVSVRDLGAEPFRMYPEWRFAVGLGDKGALEVGLTFHRIYGFPIIPGSALKGLARAAALWEIAEALGIPALPLHEAKARAKDKAKTPLEKLQAALLAYDERVKDGKERAKMREDEKKALRTLEEEVPEVYLEAHQSLVAHFRAVFGTLHAAGQAVFFDGVPAEPPTLKPDVMNVHYQDYYSGKRDSRGQPIPPADYLNPNPIPFLTVGEGSAFLFAVGWRGPAEPETQKQAVVWLKCGLTQLGAGAKTSAGYGYFTPGEAK